jgi:fructan beta-fructosidase
VEFASRTKAPLIAGLPYELHVIVDRSSVEAYAQGGAIAMTDLIFPLGSNNTIKVFPEKAKISAHAWQLKSIWPRK